MQTYDFEWLINSLKEILNWYVGIGTYVVRMIFIGWTSFFENFINNIAGFICGEDVSLTIEKLVNNEIPLLDVNFFNFSTAGGQTLQEDSILYIIRQNIVVLYYIMRVVSIIGLIITLLYLGIRIALSTIAEEKSKYKEMLISWLVSFIIVFFIHYIMIIILYLNQSFIEFIHISFAGGEESLYDSVRSSAYAIQASVGWPALIMYMILVYLLIRFVFIYIKRFLVIAILTFMAPIIGVMYSIDKIKDNKSQSFSNWLKEYTFNVILQSVHLLLYTLFVSLAFNMIGTSVMGALFAALLINFILKAESLFKKIFGIKSGSIKDALASTAFIIGAGRMAKKFLTGNIKAMGIVTKPVQKPIKDIANRTKQYRNSDKVDKVEKALKNSNSEGKLYLKVGRTKYNVGQVMDYKENVDIREIAEGLVEKENERKKANKEEIKTRMSQTWSTVLGTTQMAAAVPMTIVDGSEGLAMASNASRNLKNGINYQAKLRGKGIYDEKKEKYKGKNRIITYARRVSRAGKQVATLGMYGNIKNIKALNKEHLEKVKKAIYNTEHEIAIEQLEKKIIKEYSHLIKNPDIDRNELEEVMKSANKTVSNTTVEKVVYRISAMKHMEIDIKGSDSQRNQDISRKKGANRKQMKACDTQNLDRSIAVIIGQTKDVDKLKTKMRKVLKLSKDNVKINETEFEKSIHNQIKGIIVKEDKVKKSQVTQGQIQAKFEKMTETDKEKIVRDAVYKSVIIPEGDKKLLKKQKSGMKLKEIDEIIDKISKDKKTSLESESYKANFKNYITEEVSASKKKKSETKIDEKEKIEVNGEQIDEYISNLRIEELIQKIRTVGTYENSIQRHKAMSKEDYSDLIDYIREYRYHKEQLKGK